MLAPRSFRSLMVSSVVLLAIAQVAIARDYPWPSLPTTGFISGRSATKDDLVNRKAVFVVDAGKPVPIAIPQYAYWTDGKGRKISVIVVQVEDTPQGRLFGVRDFWGDDIVCADSEIELLGTTRPK
jgi:hypothetical protein